MTLKQKDLELVAEIWNVMRLKRHAKAASTKEDVAEVMHAMHMAGWIIVRKGDLEHLRKFVRELEGRWSV